MVSSIPSWMLILSRDFVRESKQRGKKKLLKNSKTYAIFQSFIFITALIFYIPEIICSCLHIVEDHVKTIILLVKI